MVQALDQNSIQTQLNDLKGWEFSNDKIHKKFSFADFSEAFGFISRIAIEAEKMCHHPELFNVYNRVEISLQTHDAGNKVSQKDFDLAQKIDELLTK